MSEYVDKLFEGYDAVLTAMELSSILGVSPKTVYEYLQNGDVPGYRLSSKWIIIRDEVKDHISRNRNHSESEGQ